MTMDKLFEIMKKWISPMVDSDAREGHPWTLNDSNVEKEFYWHCYTGDHIGVDIGAYVKNDTINIYINDKKTVIAAITKSTMLVSNNGEFKSIPEFMINRLFEVIIDAMDHPTVSFDMKGLDSTDDILIYLPSRYIEGEAYELKRVVSTSPFKVEVIKGILNKYSPYELTFITKVGTIITQTKNFDKDDEWSPYCNLSNREDIYTMYGMSINEAIIDKKFTKGDLYYIKTDTPWYGIYKEHTPNLWGWPNLVFVKFGGCSLGEELHISGVLRGNISIYSVKICDEIKF